LAQKPKKKNGIVMGKKGEAYRRRIRTRNDSEFSEVAGKIRTILFSPKLRDACAWIDAHPGEDRELEEIVHKILGALKGLKKNLDGAERRYRKQRSRLRVVK
jgi:hypothetical protein